MTNRRRVGAVDSIWLNMDRPNNLMVIDSVMWFDEPVDWERLAAVLQRRVVDRYPVFRQRPVEAWGGLGPEYWEDDPDFDLSRHIIRAALPEPGDAAALERYVESQMHRPFERDRPLWECHFIDGYLGGGAVVTRFHHALADGMALSEVLMSMTDETPDADLEEADSAPDILPHVRRGLSLSVPVGPFLRGAQHAAASLPGLVRPSTAMDLADQAWKTATIANKLLLDSNPTTPLSGTPGIEKRATWSQGLPLAQVKRIGRMTGSTVNDVLVSALSGAIGSYLVDRGGEATDLTTMVPVNLRPPDEPLPPELGNRFALVLLPLPSGARRPLARLSETKRRMDAIKGSPESMITFGLINALGLTHASVSHLLVDFFSSKAIGVTTNVIGPTRERYLAGTRIAGMLAWVPGSGNQTLGASILTYDNELRVGFKVDAGIVSEPQLLLESFQEHMDDLARTAESL